MRETGCQSAPLFRIVAMIELIRHKIAKKAVNGQKTTDKYLQARYTPIKHQWRD
jgi:hypothetical protein